MFLSNVLLILLGKLKDNFRKQKEIFKVNFKYST